MRIALPDINITDETREAVDDTRFSAAVGIMMLGMEKGATKTEAVTVKPAAGEEPVSGGKPGASQSGGRPEADDPFAVDETGKGGRGGRKQAIEEPPKPKEPKVGFMQKLKRRFEKTFDFEVLGEEDENDVI